MSKVYLELTKRQFDLIIMSLSNYRTDLNKICQSDISTYMGSDSDSDFEINRSLLNDCSFRISEINYIIHFLVSTRSFYCSDSDKNEVEE